MATSGDRAVVGAPLDSPGGVTAAGTAYVVDLTTGALVATLNNPDPDEFDFFGASVAISGDRAVVGANADDPGGVNNAGSAYVFDLTAGPAPPALPLVNPDPTDSDFFGVSVAISGGRVVVGAEGDSPGGVDQAGTAYVFDAASRAKTATLNNPAPGKGDGFGYSVAISGDRAVVGAVGDSPGGVNRAGTAYVFDLTAGPAPPPAATLNNPDPAAGDEFGIAVAISGTQVVVGADQDGPGGVLRSGAAFVFDLTAGATPAAAPLPNPNSADNDRFGISVAITGNRAVVGSRFDDQSGVSDAGGAYVFDI
ncbi:MAG: FG-GAP repeat protein, partial [Gemmataceae bacterium]|nr:FG-GAP repeat protein [Gemmataceae bacterium]